MLRFLIVAILFVCVISPIVYADDDNRAYSGRWKEIEYRHTSGGVLVIRETPEQVMLVPLEEFSPQEQQCVKGQLPETIAEGERINVRFYEKCRAEKRIDEELKLPTYINCIEVPLIDLVEQLQEFHFITTSLDKKALRESKVDYDMPLTCEAMDVPLKEALDGILKPVGLVATPYCETLFVTTAKEARRIEAARYVLPPQLNQPKSVQERKIRDALAEPAHIYCVDILFLDMIEQLSEYYSIDYEIDNEITLGPMKIEDLIVSCELDKMSLHSILTLLLRPLYLSWRAEGDRIVIYRTNEEIPSHVARRLQGIEESRHSRQQ